MGTGDGNASSTHGGPRLHKGSIEVVLCVTSVAVGLALAGWSSYSLWFNGELTPQQIRRGYISLGIGAGLVVGAPAGAAWGAQIGLVGGPVGVVVGAAAGAIVGGAVGGVAHLLAEAERPTPSGVGMQIDGNGVRVAVQFHPPPMPQ